MRQKVKTFLCYLTIIVLLPYIVTVFINGPSIVSSPHVDGSYVKVRTESGEAGMSLEEYCIGILAKEIPADYEKEALKAQAILVRTEVYGKLQAGGEDLALDRDFWTKDQMEEAWGAVKAASNYGKFKDAWKETEGQVVTYEGNLARTSFFRLSNGSTRDGKEVLGQEDCPYIKIVDCPLDIEAQEQIQTVTVDDIDAEVTATDTVGYVLSVRVGNEVVSGEEFRTNYHLASSCFTFQRYEGKLRITTRGVGHGLGMSQYTANEMAKEGEDAASILGYFFVGTELKEVAEIVRSEEGAETDAGNGEYAEQKTGPETDVEDGGNMEEKMDEKAEESE